MFTLAGELHIRLRCPNGTRPIGEEKNMGTKKVKKAGGKKLSKKNLSDVKTLTTFPPDPCSRL